MADTTSPRTAREILADLAQLGASQQHTDERHVRRDGYQVAGKGPIPGEGYDHRPFFPETVMVTLTAARFGQAWSIEHVSVRGPVELATGERGKRWGDRSFYRGEPDWPGWVRGLADMSLELADWESRVANTTDDETVR